ncbi:MAG: heme-binding protein [Candidatus Binataceae bacterium]|nr:heme-binding protein [Candidatus Binataceae bacterium]
MLHNHSISLTEAKRIIEAGEAKAREIGSPSNIAVVDAGGNLVAHVRMDGAWIGSIEIAINKAFTSRAFNISTKELAHNAQPEAPFFGIHTTNKGRVIIFAGGEPLRNGNDIIGAVGVSGGTGKQDQTVVDAAAGALTLSPADNPS